MNEHKSIFLLEGAQEVMAAGSSDAERAAMRLLRASADVARAELVSMFEAAQSDLVKELVRIKNNDLVTYHIDAAMARVKVILDNLRSEGWNVAEAMIHATVIIGRLNARISQGKTGKELLTAFDFIGQDSANVERLVNQLVGHTTRAASCTEQSVRNQLQTACIKANMSEKDADAFDISATFPPIDAGSGTAIRTKRETVTLSQTKRERLKKDPVKEAEKMTREAYQYITKMHSEYVIGRREADMIRSRTLATVAMNEARGGAMVNAQKELVTTLMRDGLTAFVDRSGRKWTLGNYCEMAVRTTSRQSLNHGELFDDPEQDLYIIVNRHSNCPICSKYEGRVYSRSGTNPNYPALAEAFSAIDNNGFKTLDNSYLVIHPNCRHTIKPWNELTHTKAEIEAARRKSNPATNPFDIDPRSEKQIEEYKKRQKVMAEEAASVRMYRMMLQYIPVKELGSWANFHAHYMANDPWYKSMKKRYDDAVRKARNA
jgi:hypothetical protein